MDRERAERDAIAVGVLRALLRLAGGVAQPTPLAAPLATMTGMLFDHALPFSAPWVFAYTAFWLFAFSPLFYARRPPYFRRVFASMTATMAVAYALFLVFPTVNVLRPSIADMPRFSAWLLRLVYSGDTPDNCFPSLHVALSCVAAGSLGDVDRRVRIGAWILATLVAISTVLLKQHYLADVAGGALLALAFFWYRTHG